MKLTGTLIRLGIFSLVLLLFTVMIIVVFGQMRFDRTNAYSAEFSNISGLRQGQFVRASGVEIGKVDTVELVAGGLELVPELVVDTLAGAACVLPLRQQVSVGVDHPGEQVRDLLGGSDVLGERDRAPHR